MIDRSHALPLTRQAGCSTSPAPASTTEPVETSDGDLALMAAIDEIHLELPFYGITQDPRRTPATGASPWAASTSPPSCARWASRRSTPSAGSPSPHPGHKIYPYLLRGMEITRAGAGVVLPTSPTCPWQEASATWWPSWTGPAAGCSPGGSRTPWTPPSASRPLKRPFARYGAPEIFNTDQGSQFTSEGFTSLLHSHGVNDQHGRPGPLDGQRLHRAAVAKRQIRGGLPEGIRDAFPRHGESWRAYFDFYNKRRRHQGLEGRTPDEVYWSTLRTERTAA